MKKVTVLLNRRQLAAEIPAPVCRVYKAFQDGVIAADFVDIKGNQLVKSQRLDTIRQALAKTEVLA